MPRKRTDVTGEILELPSLAGADWLTAAPTQAVMRAITGGGFEARCVGGVVRNALMGLPVTDIDIATTARPDDVIRLARAAGLAVAATGLAHGTVTVIADHHPFEVTTLRTDVETHGRHATVAFTSDWAADARRRDFTMNALYCDAGGQVWDPLGGYADLVGRRVRFIGDARERIREDYLRILRFFRFTAQYAADGPDMDGLAAVVRERVGLARLSAERVRQEMVRLLVARGAVAAIAAMQEWGTLAEILPAAPRPRLMARLVEIEAGHGLAPDAMLRLAALAVETPEDADRLGAALRLSNEERERLRLGARDEVRMSAPPKRDAARSLAYRAGADGYRGLVALAWCRRLDASVRDRLWSEALTLPERWQPPRLPVAGPDVLALGVPPGRGIGDALREVEAWWIAQGFAPDREALLARLADICARPPG